jgi:UDP-N-acetylglucosamine 3-dehydrogenase
MNNTKILVAGCGSIGLRHLKNLSFNRELKIAALDVNAAAQAAVSAIDDRIEFFNDFNAAACWKPDLVIVATPNHLHMKNCLWAFEAGAHVLCEKPLAVSMDEGRAIVDAAKKAGKIIGVGFTERFREAIEFIIAEACSGRMGKLIGGRAMVGTYNTLLCAKDPRHRLEAFGSIVLDYTHELDILAAIFGRVKRLECFCNDLAEKELKANPSLAAALVQYEKGEIVTIHFDYVQHPQRRNFEIYGDRKTLVYDWGADTLEIHDFEKRGFEIRRFNNVRDEQFVREHNDILRAIRERGVPRVSGEDGLKSLEVSGKMIEKLTSLKC